jgi:endonuclease/exonuclease/phosphatase (EEP) superfamily protein YafD
MTLRVMTYNVDCRNRNPAPVLEAIAAADADLVLLQEINATWERALVERLEPQYPIRVFRVQPRESGGLAVLAKVPISDEEVLPPPEGGWFPAQRLVVATDFGALQILNVHLRPAHDAGSWFTGLMSTPPVRRREIETYWAQLSRDLPTIVAGDFNEDASGAALAFLAERGARRIATTGPTTWHFEDISPSGTPWDVLKMDIDHVVLDGAIVAHDARVLDAGTSDHRPVVVTIAPV